MATHPWQNNGRVTVVIPTYNRAALVGRAIESALAQRNAPPCHIVVVDDGSSDDTAAVVADFSPHVRYLRQPNRGAGAARNAGIRAARSEYIAFLDADDVWENDKLQQQLEVFARWPQLGWIAGRAAALHPDGRIEQPHVPAMPFDRPIDLLPYLLRRNIVLTPTVMVRSALLDEAGSFNENLRWAQDFHLWVRLALFAPAVFMNQRLALYAREAPHSLSTQPAAQVLHMLQALDLLRPNLRLRPDCRHLYRAARLWCQRSLRDKAWRAARPGDALWYAMAAVLTAPAACRRWEWGLCIRAAWRLLRCGFHQSPPTTTAEDTRPTAAPVT